MPQLRQQARRDPLEESRKHTKRQLWAYSGLAVETRDSAEYRVRDGQLERTRKRLTVCGLNTNRNPYLKQLFKSTAISASTQPGPLGDYYAVLLKKGIPPAMARLTLARKIAAISLAVWKKGERFDENQTEDGSSLRAAIELGPSAGDTQLGCWSVLEALRFEGEHLQTS